MPPSTKPGATARAEATAAAERPGILPVPDPIQTRPYVPEVQPPWPPSVGQRLLTPAQLGYYLGRDDQFFVRTWGSVASARVEVRLRWLTPEGRVMTQLERHAASTDRTAITTVHQGAEGWLLGASAVVVGASALRGQLYCQLGITRGGQPDDDRAQVLIAGYLVTNVALGWPGGQQVSSLDGRGAARSIAVTDPAAGNDWSQAVPAGARWRVYGARATLTTDVTVALRVVHLRVTDGSQILFDWPALTSQAASLTVLYSGASWGVGPATTDGTQAVNLPIDVLLLAGWTVEVATTNLQAGDDWNTVRLAVEEWIEP